MTRKNDKDPDDWVSTVRRIDEDLVKDLKENPEYRRRIYRDGGHAAKLIGFQVRCQPSGRAYFNAQYRLKRKNKEGKLCNVHTIISLGRIEHMSVAEARNKAKLVQSTAHIATNAGLRGKRVREEVDKALLQRDESVSDTNARDDIADDCPTVAQFIDEDYGPWLGWRKKYAKSGREIKRLKVVLGLFDGTENKRSPKYAKGNKPEKIVVLLDEKINKVNSNLIEDWLDLRESTQSYYTGKRVSKITIRRELSAISGVFKRAIRRKLITSNPVAGIEFDPSEDERVITRYLSEAEEERLMNVLAKRNDFLRPLVLVALNTGMRRGELFALKWKHITFAKNNAEEDISDIKVPGRLTKNNKPHVIEPSDYVIKVLRKWRNQTGMLDKDAYVFTGSDGERLKNIHPLWVALMEEAEIEKFRFHDLRHTFASQLVMLGEPLNTVRELLNHSDLKMTLRYAHLSPDHKRESVNRLAESKKWMI